MGRKSPDVPVKPEVFAWARESDGASVDEVAKWMNTDVETVLAIESGTTAPDCPTAHPSTALPPAARCLPP